jgi:hypothetical protein
MLNLTRTLRALPLAAALVFTAASCDGITAARRGDISIQLTDAPGDIVRAVVTIDRIYLQGGSDSTVSTGRVTLRNDDITVDLLTLIDSLHPLITEMSVPAQSYGQLRFVISGAYIEVETTGGGTEIYASSPTYEGLPEGATVTGELVLPSWSTSGLKVQLPSDAVVVEANGLIVLVVDWDVAQSFVLDPNGSGKWVLMPTIHATEAPAPEA